MSHALAAHDALARKAIECRHGTVVKMTGDGIHAAFDDALDALAATVDLQQALADPAATHGVPLRVRCGLHAGMVERRDNDYFGSPVNRAARIMGAAHGGQVLLSQAVVDGVREILPAAVSLRDLGKVRLKDLSTPEHVYQVVHPTIAAGVSSAALAGGHTEQPAAAGYELHRPREGVGENCGGCSPEPAC